MPGKGFCDRHIRLAVLGTSIHRDRKMRFINLFYEFLFGSGFGTDINEHPVRKINQK